MIFEAGEDSVKSLDMIFPLVVEDCNIIDVDFDIVNGTQNAFHCLLSNVGGTRDAHGESSIAVQSEGGEKGAQVLGIVIQFQRVVLHGDVELGEELVSFPAGKDVCYPWEWIDLRFDSLVQASKVSNPSDTFVLLGDDEHSCNPFGTTAWLKDANLAETFQFILEDLLRNN